MYIKNKDKIRLCLGVSLAKITCEKAEGIQAKMINYTGKLITSEEEE